MLALRLREAGRSVVLFEAEGNLGGAWQVEYVEGVGPVECACHLIEWYAGGYELLRDLTGSQFVASTPQPMRVYLNGRATPYLSRPLAAYWIMRAGLSAGAALVRLLLANTAQRPEKRLRLADAWEAFLFQLRYRLPGLHSFDAVRRPAEGYTGFMDNLCKRVAAAGVVQVTARVEAVDVGDGTANLRYGGSSIEAGQVFLGESTVIGNLGDETDHAPIPEDYHHVVVGLPARGVVLRSDYVHTPDDPIFHRVTYVRDSALEGAQPSAIFLVQLRMGIDEIQGLDKELDLLFRRCGIAGSAEGLVLHKVFSRQYMQRRVAGRPLLSGPVVTRVRTIGDLARNVVIQSEVFERATATPKLYAAANQNG